MPKSRLLFAQSLSAWLMAVSVLAMGAHTAAELPAADPAANWPSWRGPEGTGAATNCNPPVTWSETENVRWKTAIPGKGHSTPIVWQDRVFVTTAIPFGPQVEPRPDTAPGAHDNAPVTQRQRFAVLALDRASGKTVWRRDVHESLPHEGGHFTASHASPSPVTDGPFRLGPLRDIYASPVSAADRIYVTDLDGTTLVISTGEVPRFIATNRLDDSFSASAAIAGNEIYLRGRNHLYCLTSDTE